MGRKPSLNPQQVQELAGHYRQGLTSQELADMYGVNKRTVLDALRRNGCPRRPRGRQPTDQQAQIARYYQSGNSLYGTACEYGLTVYQVRQILREEGVDVRPAGRSRELLV
jgi:uncharacterized protein (DUF433 family)